MTLKLERVVYQSQAAPGADTLPSLVTILSVSQRNNERVGLTGALASHDGRFIQVLEGPSERLDALMKRLDGDARHRSVEVLDRAPIDARRFEGWSMASARISPAQAEALEALSEEPHATGARIADILSEAIQTPAHA